MNKLAKHVVAIASGKGGVGKSTTALNISYSFAEKGYKVGLLDADIYGPSIPHMMHINESPMSDSNDFMVPIIKNKIKVMSMGLLAQTSKALVWRGPMIAKAINQLINRTKWGEELDYMFIDMPPGTGDAHISIMKLAQPSGIVMVTTPQKLSIIDVTKSCDAFLIMGGTILGIIENMSFYLQNNKPNYIFGTGNTEDLASQIGSKIIAKIPLNPKISYVFDQGSETKDFKEIIDIYSEARQKIIDALEHQNN